MKKNKYLYGWKLYVNYGQGWEYEIFETTRTEINERVKEYRANCPQYAIKVTQARILN